MNKTNAGRGLWIKGMQEENVDKRDAEEEDVGKVMLKGGYRESDAGRGMWKRGCRKGDCG